MNQRIICMVTLIGSGLIAGAPAVQADHFDLLLTRSGKFALQNGTTKTVTRGSEFRKYRICVAEVPDAVELKVSHDGNESIVAPGECQLIEARNIKLASATKVKDGMILIGSFNRGSAKRFNTSVGVAQAMPETTSVVPDLGPVER